MTLSSKFNRKKKKVESMMNEEQNDETGPGIATGHAIDMDEGSWAHHLTDDGSYGNETSNGLLADQSPFFAPASAPPNNHHHGNGGQPSSSSPVDVVKGFLESSLPFMVLLLIKISFDHRTGIMLFLAMYGTFIHCNEKAVELMLPAKLRSRNDFYKGSLIIIGTIVASISLIYYTFADQKLYSSLYLVIPDIKPIDVWGMMWIVGATDFVIKFATVALKLCITLLPVNVLCRRKRGQWFQVIEVLSQFYRSIVPITPWMYFLLDRGISDRGYWLSLLLMIGYVICKSLDTYRRLKDVWSSLLMLIHGFVIGVSPGKAYMESIGSCCPICHDIFSDPIMLACNHVFCEECITAWFDRERSCPLCRSKVQQAPRWRYGRTSASIQFF